MLDCPNRFEGSDLNLELSRALGRLFRRMCLRWRMKLQEGGCGVAGTSRDFAGVRLLGDAEQQADHQIAPEQPSELRGKFGRRAREQSGRLGLGHDFTQGGAACLASYRVERTRHFWGLDHLGDRQPEYGNDRGIAYLADELGPERSQHLRQGLAIAR